MSATKSQVPRALTASTRPTAWARSDSSSGRIRRGLKNGCRILR
jgi:hypothetical protein